MKYNVSLAIDGRIDIEVDAPDWETAKTKAIDKFHTDSIDMACIEIVGTSAVNAEREDGAFQDY